MEEQTVMLNQDTVETQDDKKKKKQKDVNVKKKRKKWPFVLLFIVLVIGGVFAWYSLSSAGTFEHISYNRQVSLGMKYLGNLEYEQAVACFERAIQIDPKTPEPYIELAKVYVAMEEPEKAIEVLQQAVAQLPEEQTTGIVALYSEIKQENNLDVEIEVWENTSEEISASVKRTEEGILATADGLEAKIFLNGDVYLTLSDIEISDTYLANKAPKGELEYMWKLTIETSLGSFGVVTRWSSDGSGEKEISLSDMESSLLVYVLGNETRVADSGLSFTSDSLMWAFSTIDNLPLDKITVSGCKVEVFDSQGKTHFERKYIVK